VAVASAGPYANLYLAPYNQVSILPLSFLQAGGPSCSPTNSIKALKIQTSVTSGKMLRLLGCKK